VNLEKPPASKFFSWAARNKKAIFAYFRAVFFLSKLTLNLTYQGRTMKVVVTYTGRNAELNVNLDSILS